NPSLEKRSASSDRISRYCCDACSGTLIAITRSTGARSRAPKSTGCSSLRNAPRAAEKALLRACGMATPCPIAVLPSNSRSRSAAPMAAVMAGEASVSRRAAASRTRSRSPGSVSSTMRSAVSRSASGMGPDRAEGSGEFAAARDAFAAAVVVHHFLLVLEQQPVELVGQQVDRRVHVDGAGVGVEVLAGKVDRGFGAVVGLVQAELGADLERLLEMPRQALELGLDIVAQGRRHLDLMAVDIDTHSPPPGFSGRFRRVPQHRPNGACKG